jgi:hypothetical protein
MSTVLDSELDAVVTRLKASRIDCERDSRDLGVEHGREWAKDGASFDELSKLGTCPDIRNLFDLHNAIGEHETPAWETARDVFGDAWSSKAINDPIYVCAFVGGALEVWQEVADKV